MDRLSLNIIPLSMYWSKDNIKLEIALVKRLKKFDKREKIRKEEQNKKIKSIIY